MFQSTPDSLDPQALLDELYPLCRSLSGYGYDQSLDILSRYIPFTIEEYASGSKVFDWTVPPRWELEHAVLKDSHGNVILDAAQNYLHVLNYSMPFQGKISRAELESHLYSDPTRPQLIPYVMSYYKDRWGFCLSHEQRQSLTDDFYEVDIVTRKVAGTIKVGVCDLKGQSDRIVQLSTYLCHPNMLNNELSGPIALVYLYHLLRSQPERYYTYRFVINPETIGSLCYLSSHLPELQEHLEYGLVLSCMCSYYKNGGSKEPISPLDLRPLNNLEQQAHLYPHTFYEPQTASTASTAVTASAAGSGGVGNADGKGDGNPRHRHLTLTARLQFFKLRQQLLQQLQESINPNFLPVPLSFQRTRQSLVDELHHLLRAEQMPLSPQCPQTAATDNCFNAAVPANLSEISSAATASTNSADSSTTNGVGSNSIDALTAQKMACLAGITTAQQWQQLLLSHDIHYNHGVYDSTKQLSDELRLAIYLRQRDDYNTMQGIASEMLDPVLPLSQAYQFHYSRPIDRLLSKLAHNQSDCISIRRFSLMGSDERQYNSPRANVPAVQVTRVQFGTFPEYHSSGDNQELFSLDSVLDSVLILWRCLQIYEQREHNLICQVTGEPQLGKRGLYPDLHSDVGNKEQQQRNYRKLKHLLTVLSMSDGSFTFDELRQILGCSPFELSALIEQLQQHGLVQ